MEKQKSSPATVDEYISAFPENIQSILWEFRQIITENAPQASEKISWGMPTYTLKGNLVHFAGNKSHVGLYPGVGAIETFKEKLLSYKTTKGAIQFPYKNPMPWQLIAEIVQFRVKESL